MPTKKEQSEQLAVIEEIEDKIFVIRGQRVMLDSDLAEVYQVATKVLNQSVKRNVHRFPQDFMFQLSDVEADGLRSQSVTSKAKRGGRRYLPYVFTEHGAVMLATVLNSPTAVWHCTRIWLTVLRNLRKLPIIMDRNSVPFLHCSAK